VRKAVEGDAVGSVSEAEPLERRQLVAPGGTSTASFRQQAVEVSVPRAWGTPGSIKPKTTRAMPTTADEGLDAVVIVQENGPHPQVLLAVVGA
jgi:hypothetical protein